MIPTETPPSVATTRARKRVGPGQRACFERLWPVYGVELAGVVGFGPEVLEVGFGHGESLLGAARADPTARVLGVELYTRGAIEAMRNLDAASVGADRVRIVLDDARQVVAAVPAGSLRAISVLFPDPWPKRRQRHRRLLEEGFLALLLSRLRAGGLLHVASDCADYMADVAVLMAGRPEAAKVQPPARAVTRFEARAGRSGQAVTDLAWLRRGPAVSSPA
jgi:tRNA (guanine-N7-)-methyltransferase